METVKLTATQDKRRKEIASRLWELRLEENRLHTEIDAMGLRYNLMGKLIVNIDIIK